MNRIGSHWVSSDMIHIDTIGMDELIKISVKWCISVHKDCFYISKWCRPWWNAALCSISSGCSLFVKVPGHQYPKMKRVNIMQGSYRLEKYLNIQDCLETSLKMKFALKSTWKNTQRHWKVLEFYHLQEDSTLFCGYLNHYKIVVPLFGAA